MKAAGLRPATPSHKHGPYCRDWPWWAWPKTRAGLRKPGPSRPGLSGKKRWPKWGLGLSRSRPHTPRHPGDPPGDPHLGDPPETLKKDWCGQMKLKVKLKRRKGGFKRRGVTGEGFKGRRREERGGQREEGG